MNKKKLFTISLAAAMALSFTACGTAADTAATTSDTTAETTVSEEESTQGETVVTSTYEEGTAAAELADVFNGGFNLGMMGSDENGTNVYFYNDDHTDFRKATCQMTDEQSEAYFNLDWQAEDYNQQVFDILAESSDLAVTTPTLPDMTPYEAYIGQTIEDAEDAGFDQAGYDKDADGKMVMDFYVYTDDGDSYTLRVTPDIADDDDTIYDDESVKDLTIKNIVFWNF